MKRNTPLEILLKIILLALVIVVVFWHPAGTMGFWISAGLSICILISFFILMYLRNETPPQVTNALSHRVYISNYSCSDR